MPVLADVTLRCDKCNVHQINVKEGELKCQNCSRSFPISKGIPNMLLNEEEV